MPNSMVHWAQPQHIERLVVVFMVGVNIPYLATLSTGAFDELS